MKTVRQLHGDGAGARRVRRPPITVHGLVRLAVVVIVAGLASHGAKASPATLFDIWKKQLAEIEGQLREQDYDNAAYGCYDLAADMVARLGAGRGEDRSLGLISAYRAIAETGQGNAREGLWFWRTAQILYPEIDRLDLDQFGPIPARLKALPFRGKFSDLVPLPADAKIEVAKPRRQPHAEYPRGMGAENREARYRVEFVVDVDGSVSEPVVLTKGVQPLFVYAMLDALRKWTFKPARANGKPVPSLWTQDLIFEIRK